MKLSLNEIVMQALLSVYHPRHQGEPLTPLDERRLEAVVAALDQQAQPCKHGWNACPTCHPEQFPNWPGRDAQQAQPKCEHGETGPHKWDYGSNNECPQQAQPEHPCPAYCGLRSCERCTSKQR